MINSSEQDGSETQKDLTKNFVQEFKNRIHNKLLCPKQNRHYDCSGRKVCQVRLAEVIEMCKRGENCFGKSLNFEYSMYT